MNPSGGVDGSCEAATTNNHEDDEGVKKEEEERGRTAAFIEIGRGLGEQAELPDRPSNQYNSIIIAA